MECIMKQKQCNLIKRVAQASVIVYGDACAVAVSYEPGMDAPTVTKKIRKKVKSILALASQCGTPIMRDSALARCLYSKTKIGAYIPAKFFTPVAKILGEAMSQTDRQQILDFIGGNGRKPLFKLEDLVLPADVMRPLNLALNQHRNHDVMKRWKMKSAFPYGNALALLFYGPPGVGKTATAEAIANELEKNILVVNYSEMTGSWMGDMKKNIVAAFRRAQNNCVIFWDEADGVLYNREENSHGWEVRPVNIMLQELEKFPGVCIFSTNREMALDHALSRRISLKIRFKPPTPEITRKLWTKLLPHTMPLADDVDLDVLSQGSLTGADIKNIILNAARNAAGRGVDAVVGMADFNLAMDLEMEKIDEAEQQVGFHQFLDSNSRKPLVKLDDLVLPTDVVRSLNLALNQHRNRDVMKQWKMDKAFPYGNALTLLFYGPPGVGKTAAAEAIANELEKDIFVADYSRMESKWLGETEKNIVAAFRHAQKRGTVIFWDEADSMLYERDDTIRSWEARSVNVILQELERFQGVCIFSTNREMALDKALSRRISLKINFKPPTPDLIRELWRKLLPQTLPLADDVDLNVLSRETLTGGDIKNIILNAARNAAGRGVDTVVTMDDFKLAMNLEMESKGETWRRIGFQTAL
jgi:SpoVK/Ycf46/Vps4 family AAA+-type ATPase/type III secretion system FlhB-like substrate exporter